MAHCTYPAHANGGLQPNLVTAAQVGIDDQVSGDPEYRHELQAQRRAAGGLDDPSLVGYLEQVDFVSLGSYCAVALALQSLGLRQASYPFDWVRCSVSGVIQCLDTRFRDFLTYSVAKSESGHQVYGSSAWGGSFWHHDPGSQEVARDMTRRAERFLGLGKGQILKQRIFVLAVNSSAELCDIPRLHEALQRCFPEGKFRILVLVDMQGVSALVRVRSWGKMDVMIHCIHSNVWQFEAHGGSKDPRAMMKQVTDAYCDAVAFAVRCWAGQPSSWKTARDLENLRDVLDPFDGGSPATESFLPKRLHGHTLQLSDSRTRFDDEKVGVRDAQVQLLGGDSATELAASALPWVPEELAEVRLPSGVRPGDTVHTEAFGKSLSFQFPEGAQPGEVILLRFAQGVVSFALAATVASAATAVYQQRACPHPAHEEW